MVQRPVRACCPEAGRGVEEGCWGRERNRSWKQERADGQRGAESFGATEKFLPLYPIKQNGGVQRAAWHRQRQTHLKKEGYNEVGMGGQNDAEEKDYRVLRQTGRGDVGLKTKNT